MKPKTTKKEFLDFFYSLSTDEALKIVKEYVLRNFYTGIYNSQLL